MIEESIKEIYASFILSSFCLWLNFLNYRFVSLSTEKNWHVKYRASGRNKGRKGREGEPWEGGRKEGGKEGANLVRAISLSYK